MPGTKGHILPDSMHVKYLDSLSSSRQKAGEKLPGAGWGRERETYLFVGQSFCLDG